MAPKPPHSKRSHTARLNARAFGIAGAIVCGTGMLLFGLAGAAGVYRAAVEGMTSWHLLFSITPLGILGGIVEAAIIGFIALWFFAWTYNKVAGSA